MKPSCLIPMLLAAAATLAVGGCASSPRSVASVSGDYHESAVVSRGPSPTSDEDLRELRGGNVSSRVTSQSSTETDRSGRVKARSTETETIDTITQTVIDTTPVAAGDEGF